MDVIPLLPEKHAQQGLQKHERKKTIIGLYTLRCPRNWNKNEIQHKRKKV